MNNFFTRVVSSLVLTAFLTTSIVPPSYAQGLNLPEPGVMVGLSQATIPVLMTGLKVHPDNPLLFDFIIDTGKSGMKIESPEFKNESQKLIKYFLASLTIKEKDLWVNLSPYEKDRMLTEELGQTELGQDMLAQDYLLKQLTASLIYPEKELGKKFWDKIYAEAQGKFGTNEIPVDAFNKVWISADKAEVVEKNNAAYVVGAHLKVMLEADYLAESKSQEAKGRKLEEGSITQSPSLQPPASSQSESKELAKKVIREVILPAIETEVNQGANFAPLRQMFYSMILSTWYKMAVKDALLNQVYADKGKTSGVLADDPQAKEDIYDQYLEAYKKGVFDYIKEDIDSSSQQAIPRKYFSGGITTMDLAQSVQISTPNERVVVTFGSSALVEADISPADFESRYADLTKRISYLDSLVEALDSGKLKEDSKDELKRLKNVRDDVRKLIDNHADIERQVARHALVLKKIKNTKATYKNKQRRLDFFRNVLQVERKKASVIKTEIEEKFASAKSRKSQAQAASAEKNASPSNAAMASSVGTAKKIEELNTLLVGTNKLIDDLEVRIKKHSSNSAATSLFLRQKAIYEDRVKAIEGEIGRLTVLSDADSSTDAAMTKWGETESRGLTKWLNEHASEINEMIKAFKNKDQLPGIMEAIEAGENDSPFIRIMHKLYWMEHYDRNDLTKENLQYQASWLIYALDTVRQWNSVYVVSRGEILRLYNYGGFFKESKFLLTEQDVLRFVAAYKSGDSLGPKSGILEEANEIFENSPVFEEARRLLAKGEEVRETMLQDRITLIESRIASLTALAKIAKRPSPDFTKLLKLKDQPLPSIYYDLMWVLRTNFKHRYEMIAFNPVQELGTDDVAKPVLRERIRVSNPNDHAQAANAAMTARSWTLQEIEEKLSLFDTRLRLELTFATGEKARFHTDNNGKLKPDTEADGEELSRLQRNLLSIKSIMVEYDDPSTTGEETGRQFIKDMGLRYPEMNLAAGGPYKIQLDRTISYRIFISDETSKNAAMSAPFLFPEETKKLALKDSGIYLDDSLVRALIVNRATYAPPGTHVRFTSEQVRSFVNDDHIVAVQKLVAQGKEWTAVYNGDKKIEILEVKPKTDHAMDSKSIIEGAGLLSVFAVTVAYGMSLISPANLSDVTVTQTVTIAGLSGAVVLWSKYRLRNILGSDAAMTSWPEDKLYLHIERALNRGDYIHIKDNNGNVLFVYAEKIDSERREVTLLSDEERFTKSFAWVNEHYYDPTDEAMKTPGGIELNANKMNMAVQNQSEGIQMQFDPAMIEQFKNGDFSGVVSTIIKITPIANPAAILGFEGEGETNA